MAALHVIPQADYVADSYGDKRPRTARPGRLLPRDRLRPARAGHVQVHRSLAAHLGMDLSQHPFIAGGGQLPFLVCCARRCRLAGADRLRDVRGGGS